MILVTHFQLFEARKCLFQSVWLLSDFRLRVLRTEWYNATCLCCLFICWITLLQHLRSLRSSRKGVNCWLVFLLDCVLILWSWFILLGWGFGPLWLFRVVSIIWFWFCCDLGLYFMMLFRTHFHCNRCKGWDLKCWVYPRSIGRYSNLILWWLFIYLLLDGLPKFEAPKIAVAPV